MTLSLHAPVAGWQPTSRPIPFRRVRKDACLLLDADRCLRLRSRYSDCERCVQACPPRVLHVHDEGFRLADGCLSCGRCSAACPTNALQTEGFAANPSHASSSQTPLYFDCWKVPPSLSPRGAMRVPCLGGVALHRLVKWHVTSEGRPIVLLDRGWCGRCSAGSGAIHPAQEALNAARALLAKLGVSTNTLPRLESLPLPPARMPADIPGPLAARTVNRREFFSGMTRAAARAIAPVVMGEHGESGQSCSARLGKIESTAYSQLLSQAAVLGERHGRSLPAGLFPALRVSDACRNHQVCTATCSTGALQAHSNGNGATAGIAFDAAACIACGDCTRACPEQALALVPRGEGEVAQGAAALTRWALRECYDCGREFADPGSSNACPVCRETRQLMHTSFSQLFSSVHGQQGEPSPEHSSIGTD